MPPKMAQVQVDSDITHFQRAEVTRPSLLASEEGI